MFFDRAFWIIYILEHGLTTIQVGIAESILHIALFLSEIPSGLIADIYGRKTSLIISRFLAVFYAIGMIFTESFTFFSFLFIFLGISDAFSSGADSALLYDSAWPKDQQRFSKISGIYQSCGTAGMAIDMFLGGFLRFISWESIYVADYYSISIHYPTAVHQRSLSN